MIGQTRMPGGGTSRKPWQPTAFPAWEPDPSTPPTYTWTPTESTSAAAAGVATRVALTVFEARELRPLPGAKVDVFRVIYDPRGYDLAGSERLASGTTDPNGNFLFEGNVPELDLVRVRVSAPDGSFPPVTVESVPGRESKHNVVVCVSGTPDLVCEIAEKQMYFAQVYEQQLEAWNYESSGRPQQIASFSAEQAHAAMENQLPPRDPRLRAMWINQLSWGVIDLGIPPEDWPTLIEYYQQMRRIFGSIPFPTIEGKDWFERCARGIPITVSKAGVNMPVANFRLYSKTHTDYFPRSDEQIEKDLAARLLMNNPAIMRCIVHKVKQKVKELERTQRTMSWAALGATFLLAPMAGGAGSLSVISTEIVTFSMSNFGASSLAAEGITVVVAASLLASGDTSLVVGALTPLVQEQIKDLDPVTQKAVIKALPTVVDAAVSEIAAGNPALSAGAEGFVSMESIGSALGTAAVKALASIPKQVIIAEAEEFEDVGKAAVRLGQDLQSWLAGEEMPPTWKPYLTWLISRLDLQVMWEDFLEDFYDWIRENFGEETPPAEVTTPTEEEAEPPAEGAPPEEEEPPPGETPTETLPPGETEEPPDGEAPPTTIPPEEEPPAETEPPTRDVPEEEPVTRAVPTGVTEREPAETALAAGAIGGGAFLLLMATGILR